MKTNKVRRAGRNSGFTLIELAVVIAVLAILAAIAIPQFADSINKSNEAQTRGNLTNLRKAISVYYGRTEGQYPTDALQSLTAGGSFLGSIPAAIMPGFHNASSAVLQGTVADDSGGWIYDNNPGDTTFGQIFINCTHTDSKGNVWTSY